MGEGRVMTFEAFLSFFLTFEAFLSFFLFGLGVF